MMTSPYLYSFNMNSVQLGDLLFFVRICGFQNIFQMLVGLFQVSFFRLQLRNLLTKTQSTIKKK